MKQKRQTRVRTTPFKGALQEAPLSTIAIIDKWIRRHWNAQIPARLMTSGAWRIVHEDPQTQVFWLPPATVKFLASYVMNPLHAGLFIGRVKGDNFLSSLPFLQELGSQLRPHFLTLTEAGVQDILGDKPVRIEDACLPENLMNKAIPGNREGERYVVAVDARDTLLGLCKLSFPPAGDESKPKITVLLHLGVYLRPGY